MHQRDVLVVEGLAVSGFVREEIGYPLGHGVYGDLVREHVEDPLASLAVVECPEQRGLSLARAGGSDEHGVSPDHRAFLLHGGPAFPSLSAPPQLAVHPRPQGFYAQVMSRKGMPQTGGGQVVGCDECRPVECELMAFGQPYAGSLDVLAQTPDESDCARGPKRRNGSEQDLEVGSEPAELLVN